MMFFMEPEELTEEVAPPSYHPNFQNAPKNLSELNEVADLLRDSPLHLQEQLAQTISHGVFCDAEEIPLDGYNERYQKSLNSLLPHLLKQDGDIYELSKLAARYIYQNPGKEKSPEQAAADFDDFVEEEEKKKKAQRQGGKKPGGNPGMLWRGKPHRTFHWERPEGQWPELANMEIMKGGENSSDLIVGKPKTITIRKFARSVADLKWCRPSVLTLPVDLFWLKFVKGEIEIFVPYKQQPQKQIKIVILDDSSSMATSQKELWLMRIFNKILDGIEKGESIMYFTPFLYQRNPLLKVETAEDVARFKADFRPGTGGGTGLHYFLPQMMKDIAAGEIDGMPINSRTEILIINDGEDSPGDFDSFPVPIHAISVDEENDEVKQICHDSGGQYYRATGTRNLQLL